MLNYDTISLDSLAVHRVGNQHQNVNNFISQSLLPIDDKIEDALLHYFLKPLKRSTDFYRFRHVSDLSYNEIYGYAKAIFANPEDLLEQSVHILNHLYAQSSHPNIKLGEVYVAYFKDLLIGDELIEAVGIFKSERKSDFIKINDREDSLTLTKLEGVNIEKLDKGCLILNSEQADGFRVLTVDNNNYDAMYWTHHFLGIDYVEDANFHTKLYLDMCSEFSNEVIAGNGDKQEQFEFLTNSVEYFANNDTFNFENFTEAVVPTQELRNEFKTYQTEFALEEVNDFPISQNALKKAKRQIKSLIKLDTNLQIKLDINNPEASQEYLERGFDEVKGMYYYKVYFNEEL